MSEWKHCREKPELPGIYEVRYDGEEDRQHPMRLYWNGKWWCVIEESGRTDHHAVFGNHSRVDIFDCWRKLP